MQPTRPDQSSRARSGLKFWQEVREFLRFLRQPVLAARLSGRVGSTSWSADWLSGLRLGRLFQWAILLWVVNLFVFGPIAVAVAGFSGSGHRLDINNLPWMTALFWAPIVEELAFRYGLRRPIQALWFVPFMLLAVVMGVQGWTVGWVGAGLLIAWWGLKHIHTSSTLAWRRWYRYRFNVAFYMSALAFAAMHWNNFVLGSLSWWLMPLLVLPQFVTGLVLGWVRVSRGIGAAIVLHALFNAGPILIVGALIALNPEGLQALN